MKKKLIVVAAILALIVICATSLVACNPYKWNSIGGGNPNADAESNGGYVVNQGNYLYYINGYEGSDADNTWGKPVKQSIVRSEIKEDGTVDNSTTKVVVPKLIYNSYNKGGFAIFKEWIYYATPNNDRDKNGTASTTDTDFMRTKIDGSVTQRLGKINTRSAQYLFTKERVIYFTSNTISYIDFSGMKTNKNIKDAKGAKEGVLAENVSSVAWSYQSDVIYYTKTMSGEESYKNYNQLCSIKVDGTDAKVLATENTFLAEGEKAEQNPQKVFTYTLQDIYVKNGETTLYYTKTYTLDSQKTAGLFMTKPENVKQYEKKLTSNGSTTLYPLGYEEGALAYNSANEYCWYTGNEEQEFMQVTDADSAKTIWYVDQENHIVYYTASSSANDLFKISYIQLENAETVMSEGIKVDWLKLEVIGDTLYFFATGDSNFLHSVNISENLKEDEESTYIGFEREEDKEEENK